MFGVEVVAAMCMPPS